MSPSEMTALFTVGVMNPETKQVQKKHIYITFKNAEVQRLFVHTFNSIVGQLRQSK